MANSTSIDALYIVDEEYTSTGVDFETKLTRIQEIWADYIRVSSEIISSQGSLAGSRANAYAGFISVANEQIGTHIQDIGKECRKDMNMYIDAIDVADSVLY
jgi:hypothetical protein